jgi:dTDP-4-amino-4,6-dideoxygalactose transaminase
MSESDKKANSEGGRRQGAAVWPAHDEEERKAVDRVLRSGRVNYWSGDEGRKFEQEFAAYVGRRYAIALANGTVALELALKSLGVGAGDEVIVPARTFVATATSVVAVGGKPVFADVDRDSGNITPKTISAVTSERTRAVIPVHLAGWPCDMPEIMQLARKRNIFVIEDCAQAHGAKVNGLPVGSFGDLAAFSFCTDKIISTGGEGGMLVTNDDQHWSRAWSYKDHGRSYEAVYNRKHPVGFQWLIESFGTNWRLTEMQSAIGRVQLSRLEGWIERRTSNAQVITKCLDEFTCARVPKPDDSIRHAYYKLYAYLNTELLKDGWSRNRIIKEFIEAGIPGLSGICPEIYREKAFSKPQFQPTEPLQVARELGETSLMFLVHPTLERSDIEFTCRVINEVLGTACLSCSGARRKSAVVSE